jgi:hypothetical protein
MDTIDSTTKVTLTETPPPQENWDQDTPPLTNSFDFEDFKMKTMRTTLWRKRKNGLKAYIAKTRSEEMSKKFEIEIKVIGRCGE